MCTSAIRVLQVGQRRRRFRRQHHWHLQRLLSLSLSLGYRHPHRPTYRSPRSVCSVWREHSNAAKADRTKWHWLILFVFSHSEKNGIGNVNAPAYMWKRAWELVRVLSLLSMQHRFWCWDFHNDCKGGFLKLIRQSNLNSFGAWSPSVAVLPED